MTEVVFQRAKFQIIEVVRNLIRFEGIIGCHLIVLGNWSTIDLIK